MIKVSNGIITIAAAIFALAIGIYIVVLSVKKQETNKEKMAVVRAAREKKDENLNTAENGNDNKESEIDA